jgi:hypothetical protein
MSKSSDCPSIESLPVRSTIRDVARFYNQHPRTIERGLKSGKLDIPYLRIGRNILIRREDIADYEARRLYLGTKNSRLVEQEVALGIAEAPSIPTSPPDVLDPLGEREPRVPSLVKSYQQRAGP